MGKRTKKEVNYSIDIEVFDLIEKKTTPLTNKSAYINNLLRKALDLSYVKMK